MKVNVPPPKSALQDKGFLGSRTIVMEPKSARQARGGVSLDIRMFACSTSEREVGLRMKGNQPL